jgi:16S rRNA (adenine1518-N6/adenine1519-N6)-dimethyltransferase
VVIDPADGRQLDGLLRRHRIDLKHRLGQNFLIDPALRDAIADSAEITLDDDVLEVGAGVGTLTVALAARCRKLVAVELDARLLPPLQEVLSGIENAKVVQADILRFDAGTEFPNGGEVVAGNIPYNITGALIRKLLDDPPRPSRLSLVVQKQVAERWTAASGASLATVAVQVYAEPRILMSIPASAFNPPPRVDSALVRLDVRNQPAVNLPDIEAFFRLVEAVFQYRRKQLGGALGRIGGMGSTEAGRLLRELGIDPARRPQTLSLREWEGVNRVFGR